MICKFMQIRSCDMKKIFFPNSGKIFSFLFFSFDSNQIIIIISKKYGFPINLGWKELTKLGLRVPGPLVLGRRDSPGLSHW